MDRVQVKGINNNLVLVFDDGTIEDYIEFLQDKFNANPHLFAGSPVVFKGKGLYKLSFDDVVRLQKLCLEHGMILNNINLNINNAYKKDLIVPRNVRSGQKIHSEGSVTVLGNVHESSEIIAGKDIIVLGKLEGATHAGFYGDNNCFVFAMELCPQQLRIARHMFPSMTKISGNKYPEIAYLEEDTISIKKYNSRNNLLKHRLI